jgi:hypothetical protein
MTDDPVRLLDEGGSGLLRALLSAAREEQPPGAALRHTLTAVGVGAALTAHGASAASAAGTARAVGGAALGSAKGAAKSTLVVVVKWLSIGALTGGVASSALYAVSGALTPPPARVAPSAAAEPALAVSPGPPPAAARVADVPEIPAPPAVVTPPAPQAAVPAPSQPEADPGAPLSAEVAALDSVRQAVKLADAPRALALLSDYEARFPDGRMLPEALYLRLEAFTMKGDKSDAEAVARRILRVYPSSPHAARARAVLGLNK